MPGYTAHSLLSDATITAALTASRASASPEPIATTANGTVRGQALYDNPPSNTQPEDLPRSSRTRTRTKRAQAGYLQERAASKQRSDRNRNTRARKAANQSYPALRKARRNRRGSDDESTAPGSIAPGSEVENQGHPLSRSASPTYIPPEQAAQPRLRREHLALEIEQRIRDAIEDHTTQELEGVLDVMRDDQAHPARPAQQDIETRVISSTQVGVGGGFHLDHAAHGTGSSRMTRAHPPTPPPTTRIKQSNSALYPDNQMNRSRVPAPQIIPEQPIRYIPPPPTRDEDSLFIEKPDPPFAPSQRSSPPVAPPQRPPPPLNRNEDEGGHSDDNRVPPPSDERERCITHVSETPPVRTTRVHNPPSAIPPAPAADNTRPLPPAPQHVPSVPASQPPRERVTTGTWASEPNSSGYNSRTFDSRAINRHRPPPTVPRTSNGVARRPRASSRNPSHPYPTNSAPRARSKTRSVSSTVRLPSNSRSRARSSSVRQPSIPPSRSMRQPDKPSNTRRSGNQVVPDSSGDDEDWDDEEMLEAFDEYENVAAAAAVGQYIDNQPYYKPCSRDLFGRELTLWQPSRDLTFGTSIGLGNFSSRLIWEDMFGDVHYRLYSDMFPGDPYQRPSWVMSTVTLNSISSCRYHNADRIRGLLKSTSGCGLKDPCDEATRAANEDIFNTSWPDGFHYLDPKKRIGHYENEILGQALLVSFFYSPKAVGTKNPGLFERSNHPKEVRKEIHPFQLAG